MCKSLGREGALILWLIFQMRFNNTAPGDSSYDLLLTRSNQRQFVSKRIWVKQRQTEADKAVRILELPLISCILLWSYTELLETTSPRLRDSASSGQFIGRPERLWSSNYISNCIFTLRKCSLKCNRSSTNVCGQPMNWTLGASGRGASSCSPFFCGAL